MRPVLAAYLAAALLTTGSATPSWAAAAPATTPASGSNDIIWDTPAKAPANDGASKETMTPLTATGASPAARPDKNGIIWDTPATAAPAVKSDANGITWNAPPVKPSSASPSGALLTPPASPAGASAGGGRLAQAPLNAAPSGDGPCREFQTTIVIDGKREPAHGTVCQQADGTWRVVNK